MCSNYRGIKLLSLPGKVLIGFGEEDLPDSRISDWGFLPGRWNTEPTLHHQQGPTGRMAVHSTSLHVFCTPGVWGARPFDMGL